MASSPSSHALLPPVGIVAGVYILWVGADHPGGGFQGGTILAAMWLLVMMAGLTDDRR
jgi:multisubunit Na+/H+ antiporter MnhB subunit